MDFYSIISGRSWWAPSFTFIWKQQLINKVKLANEDETFSFFFNRWGQFGNVDFWLAQMSLIILKPGIDLLYWFSKEIRLGWTEIWRSRCPVEKYGCCSQATSHLFPQLTNQTAASPMITKGQGGPAWAEKQLLHSLRVGRYFLKLIYNWAEKTIMDHPWPNRG